MARITKRKNKKGWSYTATVRVKGHPSVSWTFDTKGEAMVWAAGTEEIIKAKKYNDQRLALKISFGEDIEKYLKTISSRKATTTHMREKASAKQLVDQIGRDAPLGAISAAIVADYRDTRMQTVSAYSVWLELALL